MINNFNIISDLLKFTDDDDFYFLQLISRKKENNDLSKSQKLYRTWYISSVDYLLRRESEMIKMSNYFNARLYINLNKRNYKKVAMQTAKIILDDMSNGDFKHARRAFDTACGRYISDDDKSWIIDIDEKGRMSNDILRFIENECEPIGQKFKTIIPTKNGYHLIVSPFNVKKFNNEFPDIDVHKNNPTILYIP